MTASQQIPWKRVSVEAVAIVGSILLAFGVQAWWDERLERIDEAEQIGGLHAEFTENIERNSVPIEAWRTNLEMSRDAFELIEAAQSRGEVDVKLPAHASIGKLCAPTF